MRRTIGPLVALAAVAALTTLPAGAFADVDESAYYAPAVQWLHEEGITGGTSPGCFSPGDLVTRGQAAVFLHRLEGSPEPARPHAFTDVSQSWQQSAVSWMVERRVTTGTSPTTFTPEAPVTRGQFAALLHRLEGTPEPARPHAFTDVSRAWQQSAVSWMAETGITTGTTPTTFSPAREVTRAELAVFLHRHRGSPDPAGVPLPEPELGCRLVVHATGDVNLDPDYGPSPPRPHEYAWSGLGGLFQRDDLTIVNLECTPSVLGTEVPKNFNFRCPLDGLAPARAAGVDVASLANNHGGDYGMAALLDGVANVQAAGITPVGVGADASEAYAGVSFEREGWDIVVLGFNAKAYNPEWFATASGPGMASGLDAAAIASAVAAVRERADLVFVTIHWGLEGTFTPRPDDVVRAHAAIDAGADAVFGHHQHRLQPLEHYRAKPIFWGLGNFVWQSVPRSRNTAVARVEVAHDGTVTGSLLPVVIADKGHPVLR